MKPPKISACVPERNRQRYLDVCQNETARDICVYEQRQRWDYAGPRADHDRAGPEYRYLDWYATANTDYVDYSIKDIQVLHYRI